MPGFGDVRTTFFGDAIPLGLGDLLGETQGRPSCLRPTLGWETQSRWD
jgi:hypothetical protein